MQSATRHDFAQKLCSFGLGFSVKRSLHSLQGLLYFLKGIARAGVGGVREPRRAQLRAEVVLFGVGLCH